MNKPCHKKELDSSKDLLKGSLEGSLIAVMASGIDIDARRLYLIGDIEETSARNFIVGLDKLNQTDGPITIIIDSCGGEEASGYAIYDAISMSPHMITAEGFGAVFSIAAAIFQAVDIRKMAPNASYMVHNGAVEANGQVQQNSVIQLAEEIIKNNHRYHAILANSSSFSYEEIENLCMKDTFFSAEECLKHGLCDEILQPLKKKSTKKQKSRKKKVKE